MSGMLQIARRKEGTHSLAARLNQFEVRGLCVKAIKKDRELVSPWFGETEVVEDVNLVHHLPPTAERKRPIKGGKRQAILINQVNFDVPGLVIVVWFRLERRNQAQ